MLRYLIPSICWAILVLLLYAIPGSDMPSMSLWDIFGADKVAHAGVFALFSTIMIVGFKRQNESKSLRNRSVLIALLIAVAYGVILESIQGMVFVERTTDLFDMLANSVGAGVGIVIFRIIYGKLAFA